MNIDFTASDDAARALEQLGRTEDLKVSPCGRRIAIVGFANNRILLLDLQYSKSGKRPELALSNPMAITSPDLERPHGVCFAGSDRLLVANREGGASLLRLPTGPTAQRSLEIQGEEFIPNDLWLHSPGSLACHTIGPDKYQVLICNNYADYISRHTVDFHGGDIHVSDNKLLLARGLSVPDGVAISPDLQWVAVSNHLEHAVRLYRYSNSLDRDSDADCYLRGVAYPHGLLFMDEGRHVIVADAGAPCLRIYARPGRSWRGDVEPVLSTRVMSDELFARGNHNPMEGGLKGIDALPGTRIIAATSECLTLAFFDLENLLANTEARLRNQSGRKPNPAQKCPCGSKKPYRKCCGTSYSPAEGKRPSQFEDISTAAVGRLQLEDYRGAESLYRHALKKRPGDPDCLHMLGYALYKLGRYREASQLLRQAGDRRGWRDMAINYHYSQVLGARLSSDTVMESAKLRRAYKDWLQQRTPGEPQEPLVSVVLVADQVTREIDAALQSVYRQTYRNLELIVIDNDASEETAREIDRLLQDCPFPCQLESVNGQTAPQALNRAVELASGDYINPLEPADSFADERIAQFVEQAVRYAFDWGFALAELAGEAGSAGDETEEKYAMLLRRANGAADGTDTTGCALFGVVNAAVSPGNLFFSKSLHRHLGGFRELDLHYDWDFCLRALWQSEPRFLPLRLYSHNLSQSRRAGKFSAGGQREVEQMLADYCAKAESEQPDNRFAPAISTRGFGYLGCALSGNQTRLPPARLLSLHDELEKFEAGCRAREKESLGPGLNLVGYFRAQLGLGESVRALADACQAAGMTVNLRDAGIGVHTVQFEQRPDQRLSDGNNQRHTVFHLNPDRLDGVWHQFDARGELDGHRLIGMWYWETDQFPRAWLPALDLVDEVWVTSDFVRDTIAGVTHKPVIKIPHPITVGLKRGYSRADFSLPENRFLFLFNFDFNSSADRKNPWGAIEAFQRAFPADHEGPGLVIKSMNGSQHPEKFQRLQQCAQRDARIAIIDDHLERDEMSGLQSVCDAYVSLHRAEGLGQGIAELMALGKPVIATGYSGNMEFMNSSNSCPVDYSLVPVKPGDYPYYEGGWMWAEPDLDHAAHWMRRIYADADLRRTIAGRAAADMAEKFNPGVTADAVARRLAEIA